MWSWSQSPSTLVGSTRDSRRELVQRELSKDLHRWVEVANPLIVTQLNPDVVDRVEVIRGPQGSALYGSDAISGVINVLTRHDGAAADASVFQFRSTEGRRRVRIPALVPVHEQRLNLRVGSNIRSGGLAVVFGQTGALYPSSESRQLAATGDTRLVTSSATLTASARLFEQALRYRAESDSGRLFTPPTSQTGPSAAPAGSCAIVASSDVPQTVRQFTLSTSAAFATESRWTHTLLAGSTATSSITSPIPAVRFRRLSIRRYALPEGMAIA